MRFFGKAGASLPWLVTVLALLTQAGHGQPPSAANSIAAKVGGVAVGDILQRLGAKLESGTTTKELDEYANHFNRTDPDRDGKHTREEYVDKGSYMTPKARAGIFRAADGNADGVVTRAEYILNRIITDEAKVIVQGMDDDKDGLVQQTEFVQHAMKLLSNAKLVEQVYAALDANADGEITIPEYLRVWGQWARAGKTSAEERIATRRKVLVDSASEVDPAKTPDKKSTRPQRGRPGGRPPSGRPGEGGGPPSVDEVFDRNNDGRVSRAEFPRGTTSQTRRHQQGRRHR